MAFLLIDDKMHSHPKVLAARNAAVGLWVRLLAWSSDHLTDGFIPKATAEAMGSKAEIAALVAAVSRPGGAGLLEPCEGGYQLHDYLDRNPSADEVLERRRERSEAKVRAGRAGGVASGEARRAKQKRSSGEAEQEAEGQPAREHTEAPPPYPYPRPRSTTTTTTNQAGQPASTGGGGGDLSPALVASLVAERLASASRGPIDNANAWKRTVAARILVEHSAAIAEGLADRCDPHDLARAIAAADLGDIAPASAPPAPYVPPAALTEEERAAAAAAMHAVRRGHLTLVDEPKEA